MAATQKKLEVLIKKRDRASAIQLLLKAIQKSSHKPKEQSQWTEKLRAISQIFFSDEGQKVYEAAATLYFYSPKDARAKAEKALELEPQNTLIFRLLANIDLKEKNCAEAASRYAEIPPRAQTDLERIFQKNLVSYCEGSASEETDLKPLQSPYKEFFAGVSLLLKKETSMAESSLEHASEKDPQFPESYYWLWKADPEKEEYGIKYVTLCRNPDARLLRKYKDFPFLCSHISEMPNLEVKNDI